MAVDSCTLHSLALSITPSIAPSPSPFGARRSPWSRLREEPLVDWLALRERENVLVLWYEDMVADRKAVARRIADFVGVERAHRRASGRAASQHQLQNHCEEQGVHEHFPRWRQLRQRAGGARLA